MQICKLQHWSHVAPSTDLFFFVGGRKVWALKLKLCMEEHGRTLLYFINNATEKRSNISEKWCMWCLCRPTSCRSASVEELSRSQVLRNWNSGIGLPGPSPWAPRNACFLWRHYINKRNRRWHNPYKFPKYSKIHEQFHWKTIQYCIYTVAQSKTQNRLCVGGACTATSGAQIPLKCVVHRNFCFPGSFDQFWVKLQKISGTRKTME